MSFPGAPALLALYSLVLAVLAFFGNSLTLFIIIGLLSIMPTREFLRWRASVKAGQVPTVAPQKLKSIATILHIEVTAVVVILLMAALMAKGIGVFG